MFRLIEFIAAPKSAPAVEGHFLMSRLILAVLVMFSATPAFAGTARAALHVGVTVVYDPLPAAPVPAPVPQPAPASDSSGH